MKKLLAALLLTAMLLTLAACGDAAPAPLPNTTITNTTGLVEVWLVTEIWEDDEKTVYTYDEKGNLLTGAIYEDDELEQSLKILYDDEGRFVEQVTYDDDGDLSSRMVYTYNEKGQRATMRYLDKGMEELWTTVFTYDEKGNIIKREDSDGYTVIATYDENNRRLTEIALWNGEEDDRYEYTYNSDGTPKKSTRYNDGEYWGYQEYFCDATGNPFRITRYDVDGNEISSVTYQYTSVRVTPKRAKELKAIQDDLI